MNKEEIMVKYLLLKLVNGLHCLTMMDLNHSSAYTLNVPWECERERDREVGRENGRMQGGIERAYIRSLISWGSSLSWWSGKALQEGRWKGTRPTERSPLSCFQWENHLYWKQLNVVIVMLTSCNWCDMNMRNIFFPSLLPSFILCLCFHLAPQPLQTL